MAVSVRARHTITRTVTGGASPLLPRMSIVSPARHGDAHLVDEDHRTACGLDAAGWKTVTSRRWQTLGPYRCPACRLAVEQASRDVVTL
jgi:hypothetical protein